MRRCDTCGGVQGEIPAGLGTALKPAVEPIVLARKPSRGTVAGNVLAHGTGAINVDACRVATASTADEATYLAKCASVVGLDSNRSGAAYGEWTGLREDSGSPAGRWPANVLLTHSSDCDEDSGCALGCPVAELDAQSGTLRTGGDETGSPSASTDAVYGQYQRKTHVKIRDEGGASRYFPSFRYQAKAPAPERPKIDGKGWPTVKPQGLMRWLVRLLCPPGGTILDPFAGTGSTLQAARDEGFDSIGVERDEFAYQLAQQRLDGRIPTAEQRSEPAAPVQPSSSVQLDLFGEVTA